jgi:hypothetical protein
MSRSRINLLPVSTENSHTIVQYSTLCRNHSCSAAHAQADQENSDIDEVEGRMRWNTEQLEDIENWVNDAIKDAVARNDDSLVNSNAVETALNMDGDEEEGRLRRNTEQFEITENPMNYDFEDAFEITKFMRSEGYSEDKINELADQLKVTENRIQPEVTEMKIEIEDFVEIAKLMSEEGFDGYSDEDIRQVTEKLELTFSEIAKIMINTQGGHQTEEKIKQIDAMDDKEVLKMIADMKIQKDDTLKRSKAMNWEDMKMAILNEDEVEDKEDQDGEAKGTGEPKLYDMFEKEKQSLTKGLVLSKSIQMVIEESKNEYEMAELARKKDL